MAQSDVGAVEDAAQSGRERQSPLKQQFGSDYERVTGFGDIVYEHEDRAARVWLASSVFWFVVVTSFGLIIATELANGLRHYRAGNVPEALWWWQFSYVSSWGNCASAALRALQSIVAHDRLGAEFSGDEEQVAAATEMLEEQGAEAP